MKKIIYIIIFILPLLSIGQKQAAYWYFGQGAGLNFNTEPPTVLVDSNLFTYEGCATISDKKGQLLFYTDGITVYNKLHLPMPNGFALLGDPSSSQSAIIVPKPEDENIYYIFTVGLQFPGLRYSVVDMTLDGGKGDIIDTEKNVILLTNAAEKITAVKHLDGSSIWVIGFSNGIFHSFRVSTSGIDTKSVRSSLGELVVDPRGYLKASPNGEYIAMANHDSNSFLLTFFAASGKVFPGIKFEFENPGEHAYGVEFSAENKKLYVDTFIQTQTDNPDSPINTRFLYQFDITGADIQGSRTLIDTQENSYRGALQLAINGKIYRALSSQYETGSKYLGVINSPELDGTLSNYQHNSIFLSPSFTLNLSTQGLPPFIQSLFFFTINVKNPCALQEAEFSLNTIEEDYTVIWDFGDGYFSNDKNPTHQYGTAGFYKVIANMTLPSGETKTIEKNVQIFEVPLPIPVLEQCDDDNDGFANFNLNELYDPWTRFDEISTLEFFESLDDIDNNILINSTVPYINQLNPQQLWVRATTNFGCELVIPFTIRAVNATIGPIDDLVVCDYNDGVEDDTFGLFDLADKINAIRNQFSLDSSISLTFYPTEFDAEFESNPIEDTELISQTQTIWIRAESDTQSCQGIEPVSLIVNLLPSPGLTEEYFICLNTPNIPVIINADSVYDTYEWKNIDNNIVFETSETVNIYKAGNYSLTSYITENGLQCSRTELFSIDSSNIATIEDINVIDVTQNNTITVLVFGEGIYEYRLLDENNVIYKPYQESNVFENISPGIYTVNVIDVKNNCGLVNKKISVIGFPNFFTPNNDGYHDTWQVYGVSDEFYPNSKIFIFNRYGKLLKEISPLSEGWDGIYNGKKLPSDDYWFSVELQDGRIFKNHFTLKY